MRTTAKSKHPWMLQYLCLGLMILCACWLIKRFVWGDYGLLRYQAQISAQQKTQHQLMTLLEHNKTLKAHIIELKKHPKTINGAIRYKLNRIRPNETFYLINE